MQFVRLFSIPSSRQILETGMSYLSAPSNDPMRSRLRMVLKIILANAEEIDRNCQINIEWIGEETLNRIKGLNVFDDNDVDQAVQMATACIYRFLIEYDLSIKGDLSMELRSFVSAVSDNVTHYTGNPRSQIEFARQDMAVAIVKKIINTDEFGSLRNISTVASGVESRIGTWTASLESTEQRAVQLQEALEKQTNAFNFVGLHEGFSDLAGDIKEDLRAAQNRMIGFGALVLVPGLLELYLIWSKELDLETLSISTLIATSFTVVAITLLLLYFFRIALRKADSCRAQLIQVRLRMSLCRFIQSYADYSSEFKSKNEGALEKFESLIFSGIVSSDEKLPSTFDGMEQLASLAKSVRGSS
jgi:hypothetical protein